MGTALLFTLAKVAISAISTISQNRALDRQADQAANQANLEILELNRQRAEENKIAQEKKSDRVREADKAQASLIAALADSGGAGGANESRFVAETGFFEGLDLARIEGNRRRKVESLSSQQTFARNRALNTVDDIRGRQRTGTFNFLGSVISAGTDIAKRRAAADKAEQESK